MNKVKNEVAVATEVMPNQEVASVEGLIMQGLKSNVSIETMERLLAMRDKIKAEQAREAFVLAMSKFQSECPVIRKTKKIMNKDGQTIRYSYAPIDAIVEQIKKPVSNNNLSYTWTVKNEDGFIIAISKVTHSLGHSEVSDFKVPIDKEGFMTAPQKYASALTFAKRYSLCNALGISTGDEDTDAVDTGKEKTPKSEKSKIVFLLKTLGKSTANKADIELSVKSLAKMDLTEENFTEIVSRLEVIVKEQNENN